MKLMSNKTMIAIIKAAAVITTPAVITTTRALAVKKTRVHIDSKSGRDCENPVVISNTNAYRQLTAIKMKRCQRHDTDQ